MDRATPWLVGVLALAGRLGGLAVVSGMVNPYSYAAQCNKLLAQGASVRHFVTESSQSDYFAPTNVF